MLRQLLQRLLSPQKRTVPSAGRPWPRPPGPTVSVRLPNLRGAPPVQCPLCAAPRLDAATLDAASEPAVDYACEASYVPPEEAVPAEAGWQVLGACRGMPPLQILRVLKAWHRLPMEAEALDPAMQHWLHGSIAAGWPVPPVWVDLPSWGAAEPPEQCPICGAPPVVAGLPCRGCGMLLPRQAVQQCPSCGVWDEWDLREPRVDGERERLVPAPLSALYGCGASYLVHGWTRERIPLVWSGWAPCYRPPLEAALQAIEHSWPDDRDVGAQCATLRALACDTPALDTTR